MKVKKVLILAFILAGLAFVFIGPREKNTTLSANDKSMEKPRKTVNQYNSTSTSTPAAIEAQGASALSSKDLQPVQPSEPLSTEALLAERIQLEELMADDQVIENLNEAVGNAHTELRQKWQPKMERLVAIRMELLSRKLALLTNKVRRYETERKQERGGDESEN